MTEDHRLSKVVILVQQKKFAEAERILKDLLSADPNNVQLLSMFAEVNLIQGKYDIAENMIDSAIGQSPDSPYLFFVKARVAIQQDQYDEAQKNIQTSIRLDPYNADYFAFFASIKLARKQFAKALELANRALEIDAENLQGLNIRSTALLKLDKSEESFVTIEGALREDPNNAYTHANYGWGLLEKGNHKKALEHFKESLKSDPNFDYAKAGMIEALKASNPIYRMFLKYSFFMSKLTAKYQWGVIIGFYLGFRMLSNISIKNPALQPYLTPVLIGLALFAFSTWVINPISNIFLRFNRYGQMLLNKNEKLSSNFVAGSFVIFLIGILAYLILQEEKYISIAFVGFAMMVPFSLMFSPSKQKHAFLIYSIVMAVIGLLAIGLSFQTNELFNTMSIVFVIGIVGFQWVANFLFIKEDNK